MKNLTLTIALVAIGVCIVSTWAQPTEVSNKAERYQKEALKEFITKCEAAMKNVRLPVLLGITLGGLKNLNPSGKEMSIIEFATTMHFDFRLGNVTLEKAEDDGFDQICVDIVAAFLVGEGGEEPRCDMDLYLEDQEGTKALFEEARQHPLFDFYMGIALLCMKY